jgi:hypothetical protein
MFYLRKRTWRMKRKAKEDLNRHDDQYWPVSKLFKEPIYIALYHFLHYDLWAWMRHAELIDRILLRLTVTVEYIGFDRYSW